MTFEKCLIATLNDFEHFILHCISVFSFYTVFYSDLSCLMVSAVGYLMTNEMFDTFYRWFAPNSFS